MSGKKESITGKALRVALFGSARQAVQALPVKRLLSALHSFGAEIFIDSAYKEHLSSAHIDTGGARVFSAGDFSADIAISIGGDGTFLKTATRTGRKRIPIMGINTGRLGYLADVMPDETDAAIAALCAGNYTTEPHSMLSVTAEDGTPCGESFALNDVAVLKRDTASMISISVTVNDEYMATYRADGLIVSTPTGSTAYGLSNGGPIMASTAHTLCLTAVAPHSLNLRPVVIDDEAVVKMKAESRSNNFLLAVDGQSTTLRQGTMIVVKKAPYAIEMIKLPGKRYFDTLRKKLMWAADTREPLG